MRSFRPLIRSVVLAVMLTGVGVIALQASIRSVPNDPVRPVDAIVVLASLQDRLDRGLALLDEGVAPLLILSEGTREWPQAQALCDSERVDVICFVPDPDSTRGEAQIIGQIASDRSVESIALVTSQSHMRRASRWLNRCTDLEVVHQPVSDRPEHNAVREWLATLESLTVERRCESP